jgi:FkbM family methyltransferase
VFFYMQKLLRKYSYYLASIFRLLTGIREWPLVVRVFLGLAGPGVKTVSLRREGVRFRVRGPMDLWSVKETFLDRFYERFGTRIDEGWTVVDIGAGIGEFTLLAACGHPQNRVAAFEPFSESLALLQENLSLNRAGNVEAYAEAIGAQSGSLALDLSGGEPLQLQSLRAEGSLASQSVRIIPSLSLADAFDRLGLERCDLIKLDCEGAEYPILFNAPHSLLDRIERIVMEYHDGVCEYSHRDMAKFLGERGFRVRTQRNFVHEELGYLYAWRGR